MGFFTIGNLLTIGIVLLILLLYRQIDRNSRNLKLLRDYSEKLKKDLDDFVEEKEKAVKDYSVSLNVEKESARELMKRLQMTEAELAEKAQAVARIDSHIKTYENSMVELDRMTGRVQENMSRVRDESAFVEAAARRLTEAKTGLETLEKELLDIEKRFERENTESLEKTAETVIAAVKSTVSDLGAAAETIERKVEDHRQAINNIEKTRAANVARDLKLIDNTMMTAIEQAGKRADKMEEAALVNLKEQAEDRILKLKTAEEERLKSYQESAKARVTEVQNLVKSIREEWRTERSEWETKDSAYRDERKKVLQELSAKFTDSEQRVIAVQAALEKRMSELSERSGGIISSQEALLLRTTEEMKQKALEIAGAKLEEYRAAQDLEFKRLETLADDSKNLDAELRRSMQEMADRIQEDFSRYEREAAGAQKAEADKFSSTAAFLNEALSGLEKELTALKATAREDVSEKLTLFEEAFLADIGSRKSEIDKRLLEWQENLETRLSKMGEDAENARRELERGLSEEMKRNLSARDERLVSELERLKAETSAFEEGIRGQMNAADESVASLREQLDFSLGEARKEAEISIVAEVSKNTLAAAETIKQYQRDLDKKLKEMSDSLESRKGEITGLLDASRAELDASRNGFTAKIRELDDTIEDARRRVRELSAETDSKIASVRSSVEDAERHIREAVDQTKLLDKAEGLRLELERRIEDLKADMDRLDQRRADVARLENDFVKIKRLEDDVNAKMTRFLSEKRNIEIMETNFNRLIQTKQAVDEKLAQVTASGDTLQGIQLQIRKLEEAAGSAEEKYQRMERKSQILDNTNDGIDKNFKTLQDSEKRAAKISGDLERFTEDVNSIKTSIEKLAVESDKASEAVDRIDVLKNALEEIEGRIQSMQRARQWIADAEKRLEDLNREAQIQARTADAIVKGKHSGPAPEGGALTPQQKRENILLLIQRGWTDDEIAKSLKISRGEVELTREVAPKD